MPRYLTATFLAACVIAPLRADTKDAQRFARWEKEIAAIEKRRADKPAPADPVVFAGSSTIRLWDLAKSFPGVAAVNVGFGGSEIRDSTHFAGRIIVPLKPRLIVLYAGDNDIASRRTPEQVRDDFREFVEVVRRDSPRTRVLFLSVKPSPLRAHLRATQQKANALVEELCKAGERLAYLDISPLLVDSDGKPRTELYAKDGLHLSPKGYEALADALKPHLK